MKRHLALIAKIAASYLVGAAGAMLYFRWPDYQGHPDVPFSDFPEFLLLSPAAPAVLTGLREERVAGAGEALLVFALVFAAAFLLTIYLPRLHRRRSD